MDDKTEELRDIFVSVTDEETVTESQEAERGSLAGGDSDADERLATVVAAMRDRYEFRTALEDDELVAVVRGFYEGTDDAGIAADLGVDVATVRTARFDLHLVCDADVEVDGIDPETVREAATTIADADEIVDLDAVDPDALADAVDAPRDAVARLRDALVARDRAHRATDRYTDQFESILADADLATRLTASVKDDGLQDATEGSEAEDQVSF
ncbi:conditioned medium-induced protein 4 [Halobacteriales archaeon SW_7_68_16]|nr:MAG: conditioned medium-induced protein 4 [Halobacteriales archaeon SW_7_68_16]